MSKYPTLGSAVSAANQLADDKKVVYIVKWQPGYGWRVVEASKQSRYFGEVTYRTDSRS